jgi:hypothetical protein
MVESEADILQEECKDMNDITSGKNSCCGNALNLNKRWLWFLGEMKVFRNSSFDAKQLSDKLKVYDYFMPPLKWNNRF